MRRWLVVAAIAAGTVLGGAATAKNPRVSLKVENATPIEAAKRLAEASGVPVDTQVPNDALPKASFDWTDRTFAQALRELCQRFNLRPGRRQDGGYVLYKVFGADPPPAPKKPVGLVERGGIRLYLRSVSINDNRNANFVDNQPNWGGGGMNLSLLAETGERDPGTIAGVENVIAVDDLGNVLLSDPQIHYYDSASQGFPDEWNGYCNLPAPHPRAKKLAWLEGDLTVYRSIRPLRIEVPLPLEGKTVRRQAGEVTLIASRYRMIPNSEDEGDENDLPIRITGQPDGGPSLRARMLWPAASRVAARAGFGMQPVAETAGGKKYVGQTWRGGGSSSDGQWMITDTTWMFPGMTEPPVKVTWELIVKERPERLFTFRMTDIPLPEPGVFVPRRTVPPRIVRSGPEPPNRPFYEAGGGTLVTRVQIGGKPAGEGTLQLGLAPKEGDGWGATRWLDVEVGGDGIGRLEDLKPGTYRVLRVFRPKQAPKTDGVARGRWLGGEAELVVTAGNETGGPVLQWVTVPGAPLRKPVGTPPKKPLPGRRK